MGTYVPLFPNITAPPQLNADLHRANRLQITRTKFALPVTLRIKT